MKRLVLIAFMVVLMISAALGAVFTENFDGVTAPNLPDGWATENVNGDAYTWVTSASYPNDESTPNSLYIRYNTSQAMNDWVFSSGVSLTGGTSYTISFWYRNSGATFPEKLALYYGTAQNAAGMETLIVDLGTFASSTYLQSSSIFTPSENGIYYFGWHGYSDADMFYMCVDDVTIDLAPTEPVFSIDPDTWNFVDAEVGFTASKTFEVSNAGSGSMGIVSIEKTAGDVEYFEITNNTYIDPLGPGDDFSFDVEFTPAAAANYSVTITITDDQTRTAHDLVVTGNGLVRPAGSTCQNPLPVTLPLVGFTGDTGLYGNDYSRTWIDPPSYYLNGDDMVLQFTLEEDSKLIGTLTALTGSWIGMFVVNTCPDPVIPAQVLASATSSGTVANMNSEYLSAGSYFLLISTYPSPQSFQFSLDLQAEPAPVVPVFSIDPTEWAFGDVEVGTTDSKTFTVANTGGGSLGIISIAKTDGDVNYFEITNNTYSDPLGLGGSFTFDVEFTPAAETDYTVTITITDDQTKATHDVTITGKGYTRPPGSTCENPLPVTLPLIGFTGDTGLYGNDYSNTWVNPASYYLNGDDMVLQFTLDSPSTLTGTLTGLQGANWIGMHVVDRCPDPNNPAPVLALAVSSSSSTATLSSSAELPAGSYFLILSSWPTPQSYQFSLDFDAIPVVASPELTLKESSWDFGIARIDDSNCTPHIFTAVNTGNVPVTIGAPPQISNGNFTIIEDNNQYPLVIDVNDEASWTVKFTPTEPCGEKTAQMSFQDDAKNMIILMPAIKDIFEASILKKQNDKSIVKLNDFQSARQQENQAKEIHSIALRGYGKKITEEDYFEGYDNFALDFQPWTQYDGDESPSYPISDVTFPNSGYTGSFIIFNSPLTTPPITLDSWKAYSGEKMAGCFAAMYSANNDWLMRSVTYSGEARFSFFAKSITAQYGLERMKVLYSFDGCDPEEDYWEYLLGSKTSYVTVPTDWTVYEFELPTICPTATICIAIQCVSDDAFVLFIDDFVFGYCDEVCPVTLSSFSATVTAQNYVQLNWVSQSESQMMGYRVYRNINSDQAEAILTDHNMIPATNTSSAQSYSLVDTDVEFGNTYYYWLEAVDFNSSEFYGPVSVTLEGTVPPVLPEITSMGNAYPNPFKSSTNIQIDVKANETGTLSIYNIQGQLVRSYEVREGSHNLIWDSRDNAGNICSSGIYFYRLSTPSFKQTRKFMKIK